MKKYILALALLLSLGVFGQFDIQTETNYLKLINKQVNVPLLKDNFKNAEIAASHFMLNDNNTETAIFYTELSKSFTLADKPNKALYYALVQRVLFPNDSLANRIKADFINNALAVGLTNNQAKAYWNKTKVTKLPKKRNKQRAFVLELGIKLFAKSLNTPIKDLGTQLKQQNYKLPIWYNDWRFLTRVKIKEKHKKQMISFDNTVNTAILKRLNGKLQRKAYVKAIRYYTRNNALPEAKKLLNEYKSLKLPFFKKTAIPYKRLRIWTKKIF